MSESTSPPGHQVLAQAVTLVFGLMVVCGLLFISLLALGNPVLGILSGGAELGVAWRVRPPEGARSLLLIVCLMGAFTLGFSVLWLLVS